MTHLIASSKTGSDKYDDLVTDPLKILPKLDMRILAQNFQNALEQTLGYSLSGDEGSPDAIAADLSDITTTNIATYSKDLAKMIQTFVSHGNYLDVDASTTANNIVLKPGQITTADAPDTNNYAVTAELPFAFKANLTFTFRATLTNTGATQASIPLLSGMSGAVDVVDEQGADLTGGEIVAGKFITLRCNSDGTFALVSPAIGNSENLIINPDMEIAQRGTSFAAIASGAYCLDRFQYAKTGTMVHTITQDSDVPTVAQAGRLIPNSLKIDCTTADASIASSDATALLQKVEGYNFLEIAQKAFTVGFWVKATKVGTHCVGFRNSVNDRSYVSEYTINTTDTWEYKTITVSASPSAGTWDYTNGIGLLATFTLAAGSTFQTTADTWQTGNYFATANQVNACDSTSNNFFITGVQIVKGAVDTDFKRRSFAEELILCQRYYEKSYNLEDPTGSTLVGGRESSIAHNASEMNNYGFVTYKTRKRGSATITIYNSTTGTSGQVRDITAGTNKTATSSESNQRNYRITGTSLVAGNAYVWHWESSAEL